MLAKPAYVYTYTTSVHSPQASRVNIYIYKNPRLTVHISQLILKTPYSQTFVDTLAPNNSSTCSRHHCAAARRLRARSLHCGVRRLGCGAQWLRCGARRLRRGARRLRCGAQRLRCGARRLLCGARRLHCGAGAAQLMLSPSPPTAQMANYVLITNGNKCTP